MNGKIWEKWQTTEREWNDWRWHLKHRITSVDELSRFIKLDTSEVRDIAACLKKFRMAITPYYINLMDPLDHKCPIRLQAVPQPEELQTVPGDMRDPLHEEVDSPVPGLTHRYPDRVLLLVTDCCFLPALYPPAAGRPEGSSFTKIQPRQGYCLYPKQSACSRRGDFRWGPPHLDG